MIRVGINGLGRIGRYFLRASVQSESVQVKAVNSHGSIDSAAHLIKYDSVHGIFQKDVKVLSEGFVQVGSQSIAYSQHDHPQNILWKDVDIVLECTGRFKKREDLSQHIKGSVKKVMTAAPAEGVDWTAVYGVNHQDYKKSYNLISNASCTTNCLAPLAWAMHKHFCVEDGYMTTVHAYTSGQKLLDSSHKDFRRARAAALSMIPTSTGAASAIGKILPELEGKLQGISIRVPVSNVSLLELTLNLSTKTNSVEINKLFENYSKKSLKGILAVEAQPLVSCDFMGRSESSILDKSLTQVSQKTAQLFAWYDNEAGYSHRLIDMMTFIDQQGL